MMEGCPSQLQAKFFRKATMNMLTQRAGACEADCGIVIEGPSKAEVSNASWHLVDDCVLMYVPAHVAPLKALFPTFDTNHHLMPLIAETRLERTL